MLEYNIKMDLMENGVWISLHVSVHWQDVLSV
jgi:hypothetical protein